MDLTAYFDQTWNAREKLLDTAEVLSPEEWEREFDFSWKSMQKLFAHIIEVERSWMLEDIRGKKYAADVKELIDYARANPGRLLNCSSGIGTTGHLGGELFKIMTGTQIVHVPYKGSVQCLTDLVSGQMQLIFDNLTSITPHVKAGRVRGLGVSSVRRSLIFPDIPTIAEAGVPGYETNSWGGIVVPARTPRAIVMKLNVEINKALRSPELRERYAAIEADPTGGTPEQLYEVIQKELVQWRGVVQRAGVKVN